MDFSRDGIVLQALLALGWLPPSTTQTWGKTWKNSWALLIFVCISPRIHKYYLSRRFSNDLDLSKKSTTSREGPRTPNANAMSFKSLFFHLCLVALISITRGFGLVCPRPVSALPLSSCIMAGLWEKKPRSIPFLTDPLENCSILHHRLADFWARGQKPKYQLRTQISLSRRIWCGSYRAILHCIGICPRNQRLGCHRRAFS